MPALRPLGFPPGVCLYLVGLPSAAEVKRPSIPVLVQNRFDETTNTAGTKSSYLAPSCDASFLWVDYRRVAWKAELRASTTFWWLAAISSSVKVRSPAE